MSDPQGGVPAIEIHDLRKSFGRTKALGGLDLTVGRCSIAGFLGPNGAGNYLRRDAI